MAQVNNNVEVKCVPKLAGYLWNVSLYFVLISKISTCLLRSVYLIYLWHLLQLSELCGQMKCDSLSFLCTFRKSSDTLSKHLFGFESHPNHTYFAKYDVFNFCQECCTSIQVRLNGHFQKKELWIACQRLPWCIYLVNLKYYLYSFT
jgi:hypothetical protein